MQNFGHKNSARRHSLSRSRARNKISRSESKTLRQSITTLGKVVTSALGHQYSHDSLVNQWIIQLSGQIHGEFDDQNRLENHWVKDHTS